MKATLTALALIVGLAACRDPRQPHDIGEAQLVSLVVHSEPSGALVRVDKLQKTWTTPCDIADFSITKGVHEVEVSLPGFQTVVTKAKYDGFDPATLQVKLIPLALPPPVAVPVPAPPPPVAPPAARAPAPEPVVPAKLEATAGGTRLRVAPGAWRIRINAKSVVADPEKPGEYLLPQVPPDSVKVEFLDPKTDAVLQAVEFSPPTLAPAPAPEAKELPAAEPDRVGEVKVVSKTYGVFVKLDPGLALQPGEEILIFRDGKEVARSRILKVTRGDSAYPDGAAQVQKDESIHKGDEVRRPKP